jgi:formate/nitrite transporter FocA (FNT family)
VLVVVPPVAAFAAAGFEHSIATICFIPYAWLVLHGADAAFWSEIGRAPADDAITLAGFLANLVPVTLGNVLGGTVPVGIVYCFVYLRHP